MKIILLTTLSTVMSYLLGCLNAAFIYTWHVKRTDIRKHGSGNAGSTNVLRSFGLKSALPVFIFDVAKGILAVRLAIWITSGFSLAIILSGVFVVLGHDWPIFLQYKGGKGVATSLGILFALNWKIALALFVVAVAIILISKMVSLASLTGLIVSPFAFGLMGEPIEYVIVCAIIALIGVFQHRHNIVRIIKGQENKVNLLKK